MLSLDGRWFRCDVTATSRSLWIANAAEAIEEGMSGSPIVDESARRSAWYASRPVQNRRWREMGKPERAARTRCLRCLPAGLIRAVEADEDDE